MSDKHTDALLPCAFCGSPATLKEIGNDHTKTRSVQVKCSNIECRVERTDKALTHGMDWLRAVAIENWNRRAALKAQPAPTEAQGECAECNGMGLMDGIGDLCPKCAGSGQSAQGEDSARLDALYYAMCIKPFIAAICTKEQWLKSIDDQIDRARDSAETGGVKS